MLSLHKEMATASGLDVQISRFSTAQLCVGSDVKVGTTQTLYHKNLITRGHDITPEKSQWKFLGWTFQVKRMLINI